MEDLFKLYNQLKLLTESEKKYIEEGDFEGLKQKLAEKDKLMEKIDKIDQN